MCNSVFLVGIYGNFGSQIFFMLIVSPVLVRMILDGLIFMLDIVEQEADQFKATASCMTPSTSS